MERSVATFFTALAYRSLAIDWNAKADSAKTDHHLHQALDLEPNDAYNLVFAAGFMAAWLRSPKDRESRQRSGIGAEKTAAWSQRFNALAIANV